MVECQDTEASPHFARTGTRQWAWAMKTLTSGASYAEILTTVREWTGLLAEGRYQDAYDYLGHPAGEQEHWTPDLVREIIANGGWEKTPGRYTVSLPCQGVGRSSDQNGGVPPSRRHRVSNKAAIKECFSMLRQAVDLCYASFPQYLRNIGPWPAAATGTGTRVTSEGRARVL